MPYYPQPPPLPPSDDLNKINRAKPRNWPMDRYDTTGGSFPLRPEGNYRNCGACPGEKYDDTNYSNNFLRDHLMYHTPTTICALKNTTLMKDILREPGIKIISPHFLHKPGRSTSHLRVPPKYRTALCKIQEHLHKNDIPQKGYERHRYKIEEKHHKHLHMDLYKTNSSSDSSVSSNLQSRSSSGLFESAGSEHKDSLMDICQRGELIQHVRKNVEHNMRQQELEEVSKNQYRFLSMSRLKFEVDEISKNPDLYPKERYAYDPNSAMAMICARKQILNEFFESNSEKKLAHPAKKSHTLDHRSLFRRHHLPTLKRRKFTPSMIDLINKAPTRSHKGPNLSTKTNHPFSHLGLIETSKKEALEKLLKELNERDRNITVPTELTTCMYGPIKGTAEGFKIRLPPILNDNYPVQAKEQERVDAAIAYEEKLEKQRREQGLKSQTRPETVINRYTKSMLLSDDEIMPPKKPKSRAIAENYFNDIFKQIQTPDSDHELFCTVSNAVYDVGHKRNTKLPNLADKKSEPWISKAKSSILLKVAKIKEQEKGERKSKAIKLERLGKGPKVTLSKMSKVLLEAQEAEGDTNQYLDAVDSQELVQQYSDVAYSDIDTPKGIPGLHKNTLYRALAREVASSEENILDDKSSSEEERQIQSGKESPENYSDDIMDENSEDSDQKSVAKMKEMFEHKSHESAFKPVDPKWTQMKNVEHVPMIIKLKEPHIDNRDIHYPMLQIVYGSKSAKERIRQNRMTDPSAMTVLTDDSIHHPHNAHIDDDADVLSTHAVHFTQTEGHTYSIPITESDAVRPDTPPFEVTDEDTDFSDVGRLGSSATEIVTTDSQKSEKSILITKIRSISASSMSTTQN